MNQATVPANLQALIDEKTDGLVGLIVAFSHAQNTFGGEVIAHFIEKVPEKGEALWLRFRAFQEEKTSDSFEPAFSHFIASVVV
jgi:hypothetical protein